MTKRKNIRFGVDTVAITFRKLRDKLSEDNIDKEKLTDIINHANVYLFKKSLPKTIISKIYQDKEISMTNLEMLCCALNYDIKAIFEVVSEEEKRAIQIELKNIRKKPTARNQPVRHKTYNYGELLEDVKIGDYIIFGKYPFTENGDKKPIQWIVRDIKDDKLFLISRYVIDVMQHHINSKQMNWYNSTIRKWLNSDFIQNAFGEPLAENIIPTRIEYRHYNDHLCVVENSNFSTDKVFLLGYDEIVKYWPTPSYAKAKKLGSGVPYTKRKARFTPYAKTKEYIDPYEIESMDHHTYNYLLRDNIKNHIGSVILKPAADSVNPWGFYSHKNTVPDGIRPAMWIKK